MIYPRVIPVLLLTSAGLVKTIRFKRRIYLGDPINAVRIFNEKEVDELILLDIDAASRQSGPDFDRIADIVSECFMPVCYGGGIRSIEDMRRLFAIGVEKVSLNRAAVETPELVREAAARFGASSIVVSIDVKRRWTGQRRVAAGGADLSDWDPVKFALHAEALGAGELLLTAMDRDGIMQGYDLELIRAVSHAVSIPVIACGGAGSVDDLGHAVRAGGASAAAAGSLFVFRGPHRAVLINYPDPDVLVRVFAA